MKFAVESLAGCWDECLELARQHWQETEGYRHGQPFNPLLERYLDYERAGMFFMACARDGSELAGYAGMYMASSMHSQVTIATEDTFFIARHHRKGSNALRFIKFLEAECIRRGCMEIGFTAKLSNKAYRLLDYLDYTPTAVAYSKTLKQGADSAISSLAVNSESSDGAIRLPSAHRNQDAAL